MEDAIMAIKLYEETLTARFGKTTCLLKTELYIIGGIDNNSKKFCLSFAYKHSMCVPH